MTTPDVSIIVPCFNVEEFVNECVMSAARQTFDSTEIILIDDGSTDNTPALVDEWERRDGRVLTVHQSNRGLGAARNEGVRRASGRFLFFLDSDDLLPADAIERMVATANLTGSDIVSGVATKFNSDRTWRAAMYRSPFNHNRRRTHLFHEPQLLYDHIACSKLFRRDFWLGHSFEFPEGVLFEDIALVTRAHCLARAVDLESKPTYLWRERDGGDMSITQDRTRSGSTSARFAALGEVDQYLRQHAPAELGHAHAAKVFSLDVPAYCRLTPAADESYLDEFVAAAGQLARTVSSDGIDRISPLNQLTWRALFIGDPAAVAACGHLLTGRSIGSVRSVLKGRSGLPGDLKRDDAVRRELKAASSIQARRLAVRLRNQLRQAASRSGSLVVDQLNRHRDHPQSDAELSLDTTLARTRRLEARAKSLARRVGIIPRSGARARAPGSNAWPADAVGVLRGSVQAPRDTGYIISFAGSPVSVNSMVLLHERERIPLYLERTNDGFSLDPTRLRRFGNWATLRPGRWLCLAIDSDGNAWLAASEAPVASNYVDEEAGAEYRLRGGASGLHFLIASLLPVPDRPARAQEIIRRSYQDRASAGERSRVVFYECFYGRSVGCHPRAIFEELRQRLPDDVEHVFVTQPGFLHAPEGATTAQRWTRRYHELLSTSPLVITNCELHRSFTRAPFQTVVQTWHGTPLKRIGLDIERLRLRNQEYQNDLAHQVEQWTMMLSPTDDTDEIFRRAFGYSGPLLPSGSPRNDRLVLDCASERSQIRERLGLGADDVAILFAPTFRDDAQTDVGYEASPQCDLANLVAALPNTTRVLFRAHSNIRSSDIPWNDESVINVSDYPDAQDLILAGDLLVTDYSSMMFDWALTSKPIVLFAPDVDSYRSTRDFYYPYDELLRAPAARTPAELRVSIANALDGHAPATRPLVETFAHRDDGHATERVVDEILNRVTF